MTITEKISRKQARKTKRLTSGERRLVKFIRKHFSLPPRKRIKKNTRLDQLDKSSHGVINFSFAFEKSYELELTDLEASRIERFGSVRILIKILKKHKKLNFSKEN